MKKLLRDIALGLYSGGGLPAISVSPSSWDFGSTPVGSPVTKEFTIENTGTAALEITLPITMAGDDPTAFTVTVQPTETSPGIVTLAPNTSTTFTVQADADVVDTFNADISIVNNSSENPKIVAVTVDVTIVTSGLVAWYDASYAAGLWEDSARTIQAADNADVIGAWDDRSGNGYHLTQGTTGNKPTLRTAVKNGKNVIRGDGSDDYLQNASFYDFNDNYSFFIVASYAASGSADATQALVYVASSVPVIVYSLTHEATAKGLYRDSAGTKTADSSQNLRDGSWNIHSSVNTGVEAQYAINGGAAVTVAYVPPNPSTSARLDLFAHVPAGYYLVGDIAEVVFFNRSLTIAEQTLMKNYLNAKWAVY